MCTTLLKTQAPLLNTPRVYLYDPRFPRTSLCGAMDVHGGL